MNTLHCRICGEPKPREAFSSAYKNTCKECRNKQMRDERALLKTLAGKKEEIMFPNVDWGQRLFEASVSIHAARTQSHEGKNFPASPATSVKIARELIEELMKVMP